MINAARRYWWQSMGRLFALMLAGNPMRLQRFAIKRFQEFNSHDYKLE